MAAAELIQKQQFDGEPTGVCPLCFETFPHDKLQNHMAAERRDIVEYTLRWIQTKQENRQNHESTHKPGWEFYDSPGRDVVLSKPRWSTDLPVRARRSGIQEVAVS